MKAFISYSTKDKRIASKIKHILAEYTIEAFLAHDDIQVSEKWRKCILKELRQAKLFIPLLSENFRKSDWAAQEVGIISIRRGVLIIPLCLDSTTPYGFIDYLHGKTISEDTDLHTLLIPPIMDKFKNHIFPALISNLKEASSFLDADSKMEVFKKYFSLLNQENIDRFVNACISNEQVWSSKKCRPIIRSFIKMHSSKIPNDKLDILNDYINNQPFYLRY